MRLGTLVLDLDLFAVVAVRSLMQNRAQQSPSAGSRWSSWWLNVPNLHVCVLLPTKSVCLCCCVSLLLTGCMCFFVCVCVCVRPYPGQLKKLRQQGVLRHHSTVGSFGSAGCSPWAQWRRLQVHPKMKSIHLWIMFSNSTCVLKLRFDVFLLLFETFRCHYCLSSLFYLHIYTLTLQYMLSNPLTNFSRQ